MIDITDALRFALVSFDTRKIKADSTLVTEILDVTSGCPIDTSLPARIWLLRNEQTVPPACPEGNSYKFRDGSLGYQFCGRVSVCRCAAASQSSKISSTKLSKTKEEKDAPNAIRKETVLKKYGVEHVSQSSEVRAAIAKINIEKYGVRPSVRNKTITVKSAIIKKDRIKPQVVTKVHQPCAIRYNHSLESRELAAFVSSLGFDILTNDRKLISPKELDIWIPEKKVAIEYCGMYWHSEVYKNRTHHRDKMRLVNKHGSLITIFENEWRDRQQQVKNRLKSILGKNSKMGARSCSLTVLSSNSARDFLNEHHIQGAPPMMTKSYGLMKENDLVSVMSFIKRSDRQWELSRFCSIGNIMGGASRLLHGFISDTADCGRITSFADLRWGNGGLYHALGFALDGTIAPDYQYVKGNEVQHKFNHRKAKYSKIYDIDKMSEKEIMKTEGWNRIYDCGKLRFTMDLSD